MNKKRILIVDDDPTVVKALSLKLTAAKFEVLMALEGSEAVNVVRVQKPDAILLDINFPEDFTGVSWNGIRIADWLKRMQEGNQIPVFFISASEPTKYQAQMSQLGVAGFFRKPINHDELITTLNRVLSSTAVATA